MPPSEEESGSPLKQPDSNGINDIDNSSSPNSTPKKIRSPIRKIFSRKSKSDSNLKKTQKNKSGSSLSDNDSVATNESTPKKSPPPSAGKSSLQERSLWAPLALPGSLPKVTNGTKSALKPKISTTDIASSTHDKKKMIHRGLGALATIVVVFGTARWMGYTNNVLGADHHQSSKNNTVLDQDFLDLRLKVIEFEAGL